MESRSRVRWAAVAVALALSAVALGVVTSAPAGNRDPLSELVVLPGPAGVTNGGNVALTGRLVNHQSSQFTHVVFTLPIPTGASFVATSCASYSIAAGVFSCDWGKLSSGSTASVVVVLKTPSSGSAMAASGSWSIKEGKATNANENFATHPVTVGLFAAGHTGNAGTFAMSTCTSPSTPTLATPAVGPGNPLSTSVCAPNLPVVPIAGIAASISERDRTSSDPGITQVSDICLPVPSSDCGPTTTPFVFSPLATFTFQIDNTTLGTGKPKCGGYKAITKVFHDGVLVPPTSIDPQIVSITCNATAKITTVVVKASENGKWDFG